MTTNPFRSWLALCAAIALAFVALASAQQSTRPKIPPPDFKRECDTDAAGLKQWKAFDVECPACKGMKNSECLHCKDTKFPICLECDGKHRAPCRTCGGRGKLPDPLLELACPYCSGSSWYSCGLCNGFGVLKIDGADTKCGACKQKGLIKCAACAGTRRVETIKVGKKGVGEASAKELRELLEKLKASLAEMEKFEPDTNPSKSTKAFCKALEPLERDYKLVKEVDKMLDDTLKGVKSYGAGYTSYEENLREQYLVFKDRTVFLLQHNIRAAEQSLARAESNETK